MELSYQKIRGTLDTVAKSNGYDLWGIAPPELSESHSKNYRGFYGQANWGEMDWLADHLPMKLNARRLGMTTDAPKPDPGIKSMILLGMNYFSHHRPESILKHIARYAWGRDYHNVLKKRAKQFIRELSVEYPRFQARAFVDSAPVAEKALGQMAGLGWIGKNTLLINKRKGSYFFLTAIATNIHVPDLPVGGHEDNCKNCNKCLTACPTDALRPEAPYEINAAECISYFTIEQKSNLDAETEKKLNGWAFGCDICQEVCPFNHRPVHAETLLFNRNPALDAIRTGAEPADVDLNGSALKRAGWQKIRRALEAIR